MLKGSPLSQLPDYPPTMIPLCQAHWTWLFLVLSAPGSSHMRFICSVFSSHKALTTSLPSDYVCSPSTVWLNHWFSPPPLHPSYTFVVPWISYSWLSTHPQVLIYASKFNMYLLNIQMNGWFIPSHAVMEISLDHIFLFLFPSWFWLFNVRSCELISLSIRTFLINPYLTPPLIPLCLAPCPHRIL